MKQKSDDAMMAWASNDKMSQWADSVKSIVDREPAITAHEIFSSMMYSYWMSLSTGRKINLRSTLYYARMEAERREHGRKGSPRSRKTSLDLYDHVAHELWSGVYGEVRIDERELLDRALGVANSDAVRLVVVDGVAKGDLHIYLRTSAQTARQQLSRGWKKFEAALVDALNC